MGYYDQSFLNYYYYMASQFALSDRWFSPVVSKSIDNRIATFTGGTTQGLVNDPGNDDHLPQLDIPNIFEELDQANVSWKIYYTVTDDLCLDGETAPPRPTQTIRQRISRSSVLFVSVSIRKPNRRRLYSTHPAIKRRWAIRPTPSASIPTTSLRCRRTSPTWPTARFPASPSSRPATATMTSIPVPANRFWRAGAGGEHREFLYEQLRLEDSVFFLAYDEGGGPYDHVPPVPGPSNKNTDAPWAPSRISQPLPSTPTATSPACPGGTPTTSLRPDAD